jgi:hypothetical protein
MAEAEPTRAPLSLRERVRVRALMPQGGQASFGLPTDLPRKSPLPAGEG